MHFFYFNFIDKTLAEGSKQVHPVDSGYCKLNLYKSTIGWLDKFGYYTSDSNHTIKFRIKNTSEKMFFGFGFHDGGANDLLCRITHDTNTVWGWFPLPNVPGVGFISNINQARAGPNVISPSGYPPFVFSPVEPGEYTIEFFFLDLHRYIALFDFTVIDTTISPVRAINGRVWSKNWEFDTPLGINPGLRATLFIQTYDSMIDSIKYTPTILCLAYQLNFNHNGCLPPSVPFEDSRRSRQNRVNYPEYKVFFNDPDSTVFPSGVPGNIIPGTFALTPDCNGHFNIHYSTDKSGFVQIFIDINPLPGFQPEDIQVRDSVGAGPNIFFWNGLNGLGIRNCFDFG